MILLVNCKSGIYKNAPEEDSMNQDIRKIMYISSLSDFGQYIIIVVNRCFF